MRAFRHPARARFMIATRTEREIGLLRQANQIVALVHEALAEKVLPGVSTGELDALAEEIIRDNGAEPAFKGYHGFPASTCISVDEVVVHGIPGSRRLKEGQIVSIDVGTRFKGYYGDAAVSHACGEIDAERQRLLEVTDLALSRAIRTARTGAYIRDVAVAVQRTVEDAGFHVVRDYVGHGIGTEMHMEPQVPNFDTGRSGPRLKAGMLLAIEPMVNVGTHEVMTLEDGWTVVTVDGKPSAHFEHSIVVRDGGGEILSMPGALVWGQRTDTAAGRTA